MPPVLFALVILEIVPPWPGPQSYYFMLPKGAGMTDVYHAQIFSFEKEEKGLAIFFFFLPGLAWNQDPPDHSLPSSEDLTYEFWIMRKKYIVSRNCTWNFDLGLVQVQCCVV
jgi:hypothetical protein